MTLFHAVLLFVAVQRGGELLLARANTAALLRRGAHEIDPAGYRYIVLLHAAWLVALIVVVPSATPPNLMTSPVVSESSSEPSETKHVSPTFALTEMPANGSGIWRVP